MHRPPARTFAYADDRIVLAHLVQRMQAVVWEAFHALVDDEWEQQEEQTPTRDLPIHELYGNVEAPHDTGLAEPNQEHLQDTNHDVEQGCIQHDWPTSRMATYLKRLYKEYPWDLSDEEYDTRIVLGQIQTDGLVDYSPGSTITIRGKGKINCGIDVSPIILEGVKWWMGQLRWTPQWADCPPERPAHNYTSVFLEFVVDCEAATGLEIPATCWHTKAIKLATIMRTLARIHTLEMNGRTTTWKDAFDPRTATLALTPLGAPRLSGVARRPRWLSQATPGVVAANAWRS